MRVHENFRSMETNYSIIAIAIFIGVMVIVVLVLKNRKDKKDFEHKIKNENIDPEHHKEERI